MCKVATVVSTYTGTEYRTSHEYICKVAAVVGRKMHSFRQYTFIKVVVVGSKPVTAHYILNDQYQKSQHSELNNNNPCLHVLCVFAYVYLVLNVIFLANLEGGAIASTLPWFWWWRGTRIQILINKQHDSKANGTSKYFKGKTTQKPTLAVFQCSTQCWSCKYTTFLTQYCVEVHSKKLNMGIVGM